MRARIADPMRARIADPMRSRIADPMRSWVADAVRSWIADPMRSRIADRMHELSLSSAIVNTALRHAGGHRVAVVSVSVGRLRQVVPQTLAFAFAFVSRDTLCEGARLELQVIDARLRCRPCGREWEIEIPAFRCPTCGGAEVEIAAGEEFLVESIEVMREVAPA